MRRVLASSRFRRRSAWLAVCLAVAGTVAFVGIHFSNTGHSVPQRFTAQKPKLVAKSPKADVFTNAERRQVRAVAVRFIESAVYRKNVPDSFAITTSGLRQGESRAEWATGTIPVVPYPAQAVDTVRWRVNYSYADEVGLKVAFYPKPASGADRQVFDIALQNHGSAAAPHWLVSYWAPSGGVQLSRADPRAPSIDTTPPKPPLGAIWLLVPVGIIVGGLVGVVAFLVVRGRIRHARATRLYRSSSSPS
jgi:uncharacterized SAM-binding protein YcdF (DUF218 family)